MKLRTNPVYSSPQTKILSTNPMFTHMHADHEDQTIHFKVGPFSPHWDRRFVTPTPIFGRELVFTSLEQFVMASKATLFGDLDSFLKIMETNRPDIAKALGRKVIGSDPTVWDTAKYDILALGAYLKFSPNDEYQAALKLTHGYSLRYDIDDLVWGTGRNLESESSAPYPGQNLVGKALEDVREKLLSKDARFAPSNSGEG